MPVRVERDARGRTISGWSRVAFGSILFAAAAACGSDSTSPEPGPLTYSSIVNGDYLSCDIRSGGQAYCWGELGDNTGTTVEEIPVAVGGTVKFASLTAYATTVCGLTSAGKAYCWGPNTDGQLGIGSFDAGVDVPTAVVGGIDFKMISAGDAHTCGVSTTGIGYCWGDNVDAQSGHSNTADVDEPTVVQGGHNWSMISAGTINSCGATIAGAAYCWGSDTYGQLGDGGTISGLSSDTSAMPVLVAGGLTWKIVSVGQFHACGLTTGGVAYCWGYNDHRVGDDTDVDRSAPVPVSGGRIYKTIDAGRYTTCAITDANDAYCWGGNLAGQFGTELPASSSGVPVLAGGMKFAEIRTSSLEHTCGISLDRTTVKCFGRNDYGQVGDGTTVAATVHNWQPKTVVGQSPQLPD